MIRRLFAILAAVAAITFATVATSPAPAGATTLATCFASHHYGPQLISGDVIHYEGHVDCSTPTTFSVTVSIRKDGVVVKNFTTSATIGGITVPVEYPNSSGNQQWCGRTRVVQSSGSTSTTSWKCETQSW